MRIALSVILGIFVSLHLQALPAVNTGPLPDWLCNTHSLSIKIPDRDDISDGFYYELLDLQSNLSCRTEYTHYIRNIVNGSGVQNGSEVSVTFSPQFQQVIFHHIDIIRDGKVLHRLQLGRIKVVQEETDADEFQYNGLKRAFLTLEDVRKGDRIDVAFSVVGFNPVFDNKYSDEFSFNSPTAVCNYYKTIVTTPDRPLHILTLNNAPAPAERRRDNWLIYTWDNPPLDSSDAGSDSNVPSWYNSSPTVYVTEYPGWAAVVDWGLNTFNHYRYALPATLQQKILDWKTRSGGDKVAFTSSAIRFVQDEVRYLGLEIGANTHRPHPPGEVFDHRYGDCKDKALLLSTILQQENIPAYVALINTDTRSQLTTVAPSPQAFDHAIVAIRRTDGKYDFVDPTLTGQRGPLPELFIPAYGYALVLRDGETALTPVTPGRINDYSIIETLEAPYYDTSHFSISSVYTGGAADDVRNMFAEKSDKDLGETYRKYYATLFDGVHQDHRIFYNDDSAKNIVTVRKQYSIPQLWKKGANGQRYFEFAVKILAQALPDPSDAPEDIPLALPYPFNVHYTLDLDLPDSWTFEELHVRTDDYQFDFDPITSGNSVSLHYSFKTFSDHIPVSAVRQYKEDYKNISDKISFRLSRTIDETSPPSGEETLSSASASTHAPTGDWKACWPAIWLTFFFSLLFSRLFQYLNSRGEETLYAPGSGYPLGGWLILLGLSLAAMLVFGLVRLFQDDYYNYSNWSAYTNAGGAPLQYLYLTQLAVQLSVISGSGALLYWFLKKRDIFPRMFLWYAGILLCGRLLLLVSFYVTPVPGSLTVYRSAVMLAFIRSAIYAIIWVSYILRSGQVKSTFLEPFRERIR